MTLLVLAGSVTLLVTGPWPLRVLGAIGLPMAYVLRPRFGRLAPGVTPLRRDEAPALYALADRVAAAVGSRPVDVIVVGGDFNASYARYGVRNRSLLVLGLPLWAALTPQQRIALLGHEFGHDVNGDSRRGRWLGSALWALEEWHRMTLPDRSRSEGVDLVFFLAGTVQRLLMGGLNALVTGLYRALERLTVRSGQAAEYRADALAAGVGGTAAVRGVLEVLLLHATAESVVLRRRNRPRPVRRTADGTADGPDLWTELAERIAAVPPSERERRLRLSARELGAVDATHPPTHLRLRMLTTRPPVTEPSVTADPAQQGAVEAELAPHRVKIAEELRQQE
ncbi:M48 family metallopeptidase [Kitasatospora sp. NPDC048540]|uniref:M48 family metallopeptidase n=1 Tax=Kitasatospora sp. NPDC048540 TaxID=3155634 RepID=UPI0033E309EC